MLLICTILCAVFLLCVPSLHAQTVEGTEFWLTFGQNFDRTADRLNEIDLQIRIVSGDKPSSGTIRFTNLGTSVDFNLAAQQVFTYSLNEAQKEAVYNTTMGVSDRSVHITSNESITVYALNQSRASADATNILPVTVLGTEYYHISYRALVNIIEMSRREDAYAVVAITDNTRLYNDGAFAAMLNQGEVYYSTTCSTEPDLSGSTDMTGSHITADNPVAFFAVNQGPNVPGDILWSDCLFQQLAPINTWGKKFFVPVSHMGRDIVRIVASQNGTNISQTGGILRTDEGGHPNLTNLQAGQFVDLVVSLDNNGCFIQADKPVGVCTYLTGLLFNFTMAERNNGTGVGDPAQAWLPAIAQTVTEALIAPFVPTGTTYLSEHYALIITPTATKDDTRFSIGEATPTALSGGAWRDNDDAGMSFYSMRMTNPNDSYLFTNQAGLFIMCYGVGTAESYYFLAFSAMRDLLDAVFFADDVYYLDLPDNMFREGEIEFRAQVSGMGTAAGNLRWFIDGVEEMAARDQLTWKKYLASGEYDIKAEVRSDDGQMVTLESTLLIGVQITVDASPSQGGTVSGGGSFAHEDPVTVNATANTDYYFVNWTENDIEVSTDPSYTFIVTENRSLVANFRLYYIVNVDVNILEYGYATGAGSLVANALVRVEAHVNDCYRFSNWTVNDVVVSTENPYSFAVTEDVDIVANLYALDFDEYAPVLWDNTFMLNLKKLEEDGYNVTGCRWFKNDIEEMNTRTINEFSYSAGYEATDKLETGDYMFMLITADKGALCSTVKSITNGVSTNSSVIDLHAYPNPLPTGSEINLEGVIEGSIIRVYTVSGVFVKSIVASDSTATLNLSLPSGVYIVHNGDKSIRIVIE